MERHDRGNRNYDGFYANNGNSYHTNNHPEPFEANTQDFRHQAWPERDYIRGYHQDPTDWNGRDMSRDYDHLHQYSQNQQPQFGQDQRNQGNGNRYQDQTHSYYRHDQNGRQPYSHNFSQDHDLQQNYQQNFRQDPTLPQGSQDEDLMGNIRQGYGISSYDGTSDRFNTLDSQHRYGTQQDAQAYYSGDRDGYRSSQYGGGLGGGDFHSHRGIPDYGRGNFAENEGTGMGSSYGGTNYGGGHGYSGGHRGGTWGNSAYGSYSGNFGGNSPMGGSTYGSGRSSYGDTSHNSDRGVRDLGGH